MTTESPYESAKLRAERLLLGHHDRPLYPGGEHIQAARIVSASILPLAEAVRPQPAEFKVTVSDAVVDQINAAVEAAATPQGDPTP